MINKFLLATVIVVGMISFSIAPAWGQSSEPMPSSAASCKALASTDFSTIQDAPTQITESKLVDAKDDSIGFCQVQGYVWPQVGFELRLPASEWNGKFLEVGCGGPCGVIYATVCETPLRNGYACIASDMGHKGSGNDGTWAYNNLQAKIDWGYRATHVVALAGKVVTTEYYSKIPKHSYFVGCSTGGRQGMIEAQRFPSDFDGIIAGAPLINESDLLIYLAWVSQIARDKRGNFILNPADLKLVHEAALAQCDMDDGLKDGIISSANKCNFDPKILVCNTTNQSNCLTPQKLEIVKKIYAGTSSYDGKKLSVGGALPGSELNWTNYESWGKLGIEMLKYMVFMPDPGSSWKLDDLEVSRDLKRIRTMEALYSAANPDLRKFKAAGGKLIAYHGWADEAVLPVDTVDYYETVEKVMGGREATQDFFRLFVIPGMGHCGRGEGAGEIDYLSHLESWVEKGQPPDMMIGAHVDSDQFMRSHDRKSESFTAEYEKFRHDQENVKFSRPVYPYPLMAKYKGTGDPNLAKNFYSVLPH